jgi:hypothetical protein
MLTGVVKVLLAILPSAGVLYIFWLGIKALIEADRRERKAEAQWDAATGKGTTGKGTTGKGSTTGGQRDQAAGVTGPNGTGSNPARHGGTGNGEMGSGTGGGTGGEVGPAHESPAAGTDQPNGRR